MSSESGRQERCGPDQAAGCDPGFRRMWLEGLQACESDREIVSRRRRCPIQKETQHCGPLGREGHKVDNESCTAPGW